MEYKKYLQHRIDALTKQHQETKAAEKQAEQDGNMQLRLSYNSHAASLFAVMYELQLAIENYDKSPNSGAAKLLAKSTDQLIHIIRSNTPLEHDGDLSQVMNDSRELLHEIFSNHQ